MIIVLSVQYSSANCLTLYSPVTIITQYFYLMFYRDQGDRNKGRARFVVLPSLSKNFPRCTLIGAAT
jgi:hypothetical protein